MEKDHPLIALIGKKTGHYRIKMECKPLRSRQGWTHFSLYLEDPKKNGSSHKSPYRERIPSPVLQGIHSRGGKEVKGWIEVEDYRPVTHLHGFGNASETFTLSKNKIDQQIFNLLSEVIPPGGHLMFVYEVAYESPLHQETQQGLLKGFPPVSTPQGELLFHCGCRWVKDWYLAEGGHEGLRKLWGEKPLDEKELRRFDLLTFFQILSFLSRKPNLECLELELKARKRIREILSELKIASALSTLRNKLIAIYRDDLNKEVVEKASRHCRQLIDDYKTTHSIDVLIREELDRISKESIGIFSPEG